VGEAASKLESPCLEEKRGGEKQNREKKKMGRGRNSDRDYNELRGNLSRARWGGKKSRFSIT